MYRTDSQRERHVNIEKQVFEISLGLGLKDTCLLHSFCKARNIECNGNKKAFCRLEYVLDNDSTILSDLKQNEVMASLQQLYDLHGKTSKTMYLKGNSMICPFLHYPTTDCDLKLCPYYSQHIDVKCILSLNAPSFSHIALAKGMTEQEFISIIFKYSDQWEYFETMLSRLDFKVCNVCEHALGICRKDNGCKKRQKLVSVVKGSNLIPQRILKNYPVIYILLSAKQVFSNFSKYLYPEKIWRSYLKFLTEV